MGGKTSLSLVNRGASPSHRVEVEGLGTCLYLTSSAGMLYIHNCVQSYT